MWRYCHEHFHSYLFPVYNQGRSQLFFGSHFSSYLLVVTSMRVCLSFSHWWQLQKEVKCASAKQVYVDLCGRATAGFVAAAARLFKCIGQIWSLSETLAKAPVVEPLLWNQTLYKYIRGDRSPDSIGYQSMF